MMGFAPQRKPLENSSEDSVFCGRCKFYKTGDYRDECKAEFTWHHNNARKWKRYKNPDNKNSNNNCEDFEPSFILMVQRKIHGIIQRIIKIILDIY